MEFRHLLLGLLLFVAIPSLAQEVKNEQGDGFGLSLEELMNIPINSASKKEETLFDAPLSSYTITRSEIEKAGSTTIMEALRLAPGVIVREQTNGVYDIHVRGFDNVLRSNETYAKSNTSTLVMIDNRPVFNHNLGGTFWEALPIDLNDVERIEIVRGPSAPLFGPNAVTGVINIITRKAAYGTYASATVQYGTPNTLIANGSFGKKINDAFSFGLSLNHQEREKYDDTYYVNSAKDFLTLQEIFGTDQPDFFPNPTTSLQKTGANGYVTYSGGKNFSIDLSAGFQESESQKIFLSGVFTGTPFTTNTTKTRYASLNTTVHGLKVRSSILQGKDDLSYNQAPNKYDYSIADVEGEYAIQLGEIGNLVPGVSYQTVTYTDANYAAEGFTFLNGTEQSIQTLAGFIRTDLAPTKNWRVIAALRLDKFSTPDDVYLAYEFATTYKLNESNLVRAAITRSNSGSFVGNNYLNFIIPDAGGPGADFVRQGNQDLRLVTVNMIELGYRTKIAKAVQFDIDLFRQQGENFTALITKNPLLQEFDNIPLTVVQAGATFSLNIVPNEQWQLKPFFTVQSTESRDLPSSYLDSTIDPTLEYTTSKHKNTPAIFGGYYVNFQPNTKFTFNLNGYFFGSQRQYDDQDPDNTLAAGDINGKVLVNVKAAYNITPRFSVYVNGRNALNSESREFFGADKTQALYLAGASFQLK